MKVLHVITGLSSGGAEMMLYKLLSSSSCNRFESVVVSLVTGGSLSARIRELGIPVYTLGMRRAYPSLIALWQLIWLIKKIQPDVIQGWMYHANIAVSVACMIVRRKMPVAWGIHHSLDDIRNEKMSTALIIKMGRCVSRYPAKIIYCSKKSSEQHHEFGYTSEQALVIPNGFDTDLFKPSQEAGLTLRDSLQIGKDTILIGLIARYHPMKDHENFFRAAKLLNEENDNVHFLLAGQEISPNNAALVGMIQRYNLDRRAHLLGEQRDIVKIIAGLDIASLSSSHGEAFPNVIGEAMACGVSFAATDVGDSAWIIGKTGRAVPPRNPHALAQAWAELIEMGAEQRRQMGQVARARIVQSFSIASVSAQYERVYQELLKQPASNRISA